MLLGCPADGQRTGWRSHSGRPQVQPATERSMWTCLEMQLLLLAAFMHMPQTVLQAPRGQACASRATPAAVHCAMRAVPT